MCSDQTRTEEQSTTEAASSAIDGSSNTLGATVDSILALKFRQASNPDTASDPKDATAAASQISDDEAAGLQLTLSAAELAKMANTFDSTVSKFEVERGSLEAAVGARTAELESAQHRLAVVIDSISDGVISIDANGVIESFNRSAQQIFDCSESFAKGNRITIFLGDNFLEELPIKPTSVIATRRLGMKIKVEVLARIVGSGAAKVAVLTIRNMTDVKYTQKRLDEQAFLLENSKSFVITTDPNGRIDWCNPYFESLAGYKVGDLWGRRPSEFLFHKFTSRRLLRQGRAEDGSGFKAFTTEIEIRHASGRPVWVSFEAHPMFDENGTLEKFVTLGVDITEQKRHDQQQVDFISMVSHELRTPLTVVSGSLEAIAWGMGGKLSEMHEELIAMAIRNCEHLSTLIEDLLDVNKLEAGTVRFHSEIIDICDPVKDAVRTVVPLAEDKQIALNIGLEDVEYLTRIDPQRLRQVMINFLSNAIKFSEDNTTIRVFAEQREEVVRVSVSDQGRGIPEEFYPKVFKKFARDVAVQACGTDGFGLGLAISKGLVEQMGGTIGFDSTLGEGSTFFVEFQVVSADDSSEKVVANAAQASDEPEAELTVDRRQH